MGHANREAAYSPLWLMLTVTWKPNADKRVLKSEEEVLDAAQKGWVTLLSTGVVVNCPIVHRGPRCCRSPATAAWQPPATQNTARCRGQKTHSSGRRCANNARRFPASPGQRQTGPTTRLGTALPTAKDQQSRQRHQQRRARKHPVGIDQRGLQRVTLPTHQ